MEINVTEYVENVEHSNISASAMEMGQNVGQITWNNAKEQTEEYNFLDTEEKKQACRDHFAEYGAWTEDEINSWSDTELNAIFLQDVSASYREIESYELYEDMNEAMEQGEISGRLYPSDSRLTDWFFYLGT